MIDVLLIHTNASGKIYQSLNKVSQIEPPVWALMLAGNLQKNNYEVQILDAEADGLTPEETADEILKRKAKLNCFVNAAPWPGRGSKTDGSVINLTDTPLRV